MKRRTFLRVLGSAAIGAALAPQIPSVLVDKRQAKIDLIAQLVARAIEEQDRLLEEAIFTVNRDSGLVYDSLIAV